MFFNCVFSNYMQKDKWFKCFNVGATKLRDYVLKTIQNRRWKNSNLKSSISYCSHANYLNEEIK